MATAKRPIAYAALAAMAVNPAHAIGHRSTGSSLSPAVVKELRSGILHDQFPITTVQEPQCKNGEFSPLVTTSRVDIGGEKGHIDLKAAAVRDKIIRLTSTNVKITDEQVTPSNLRVPDIRILREAEAVKVGVAYDEKYLKQAHACEKSGHVKSKGPMFAHKHPAP